MEMAIESFLQELSVAGRQKKTLEWHQTSLLAFSHALKEQQKSFPEEITTADVRHWLGQLRNVPSDNGTLRSASTVQTYLRSARAFCHWLVQLEHLERTPFVKGLLPKVKRHPVTLIEPEVFEDLLRACGQADTFVDYATARNRALLWLFLESGLLVSEVCTLYLEDFDREGNFLRVVGNKGEERHIVLGVNGRRALLLYLDRYRLRGKKQGQRALFLSEKRQPLTTNAITQVFLRLNTRAGLTDKHVSPTMLRDTFAIQYLRSGGNPKQLQEQLGLVEKTAIKRYQDAARSTEKRTPVQNRPGEKH
jgi:site-specific recombinase XerD